MNHPLVSNTKKIQTPQIFFLIGLMGSGKTHWARHISANSKFNFIDLDTTIEKEASSSISQIFATQGEIFFREKETEILTLLPKRLKKDQQTIVATGGGTACFNDNMKWMNENGITIWLNEAIENIVQRVSQQKNLRPLISQLSQQDLFNYFTNQLQERKQYYNQSDYCLNRDEITAVNLKKIMSLYV